MNEFTEYSDTESIENTVSEDTERTVATPVEDNSVVYFKGTFTPAMVEALKYPLLFPGSFKSLTLKGEDDVLTVYGDYDQTKSAVEIPLNIKKNFALRVPDRIKNIPQSYYEVTLTDRMLVMSDTSSKAVYSFPVVYTAGEILSLNSTWSSVVEIPMMYAEVINTIGGSNKCGGLKPFVLTSNESQYATAVNFSSAMWDTGLTFHNEDGRLGVPFRAFPAFNHFLGAFADDLPNGVVEVFAAYGGTHYGYKVQGTFTYYLYHPYADVLQTMSFKDWNSNYSFTLDPGFVGALNTIASVSGAKSQKFVSSKTNGVHVEARDTSGAVSYHPLDIVVDEDFEFVFAASELKALLPKKGNVEVRVGDTTVMFAWTIKLRSTVEVRISTFLLRVGSGNGADRG